VDLLIADDDPQLRELLRELLEAAGHVVACAVDGAQALSIATGGGYAVAVLDIDMPGLSGWDVATALRANRRTEAMHLVAVSGRATPRDIERSENAGFDLHLAKPLTGAQLFAAIEPRGVPAWRVLSPP
jgi:CheY-like chemotaxis protein